MPDVVLSVVIIGRNEGERLRRCLESVKNMDPIGGDVEVIYVDSGSVDNSIALAQGYGAKTLKVESSRPTAALGRNTGWRVASAPIVLFLDGDTVLNPSFVNNSLPEFEDPEVAIVWGHRREMFPENTLYNRVLDLDWIYPPGPSEFCGGDALMRKAVLEEVNGYDSTLIAGEEPEMCGRIRSRGYEILHVDHKMTGHDLAMTRWSQYWRRAFRAGYAYAQVSRRFKDSPTSLWGSEVRRNFIRAVFVVGLIGVGVAASLFWMSVLPILAVLAFFILLAVRTAGRVRWKCEEFSTRFLYGLHSHLQHLPIAVGQLAFLRDLARGRDRHLIEYKGAENE